MQFHCAPAWRVAERGRCSGCRFLDQTTALAFGDETSQPSQPKTPKAKRRASRISAHNSGLGVSGLGVMNFDAPAGTG